MEAVCAETSFVGSRPPKPTVVDKVSTVVDGVKRVHCSGGQAIAAKCRQYDDKWAREDIVDANPRGGVDQLERGQAIAYALQKPVERRILKISGHVNLP